MKHTEAKAIVDSIVPDQAQSLFTRAVANHETSYGAGWKAGQGAGSFNMGAITRPGSFNSPVPLNPLDFKHEDSRFDPKKGEVVKYVTWFKGYPDTQSGFADLTRVLLKPNVIAAISTGSLRAGAAAMRDNNYYLGVKPTREEQIDDYFQALSRAVSRITEDTGELNVFSDAGGGTGSSEDPKEIPALFDDRLFIEPVEQGGKLIATAAVLIVGYTLWKAFR